MTFQHYNQKQSKLQNIFFPVIFAVIAIASGIFAGILLNPSEVELSNASGSLETHSLLINKKVINANVANVANVEKPIAKSPQTKPKTTQSKTSKNVATEPVDDGQMIPATAEDFKDAPDLIAPEKLTTHKEKPILRQPSLNKDEKINE
jgi:hypothetical protein